MKDRQRGTLPEPNRENFNRNGKDMAGWTHNNWRSETDLAQRRAKLIQHIEEVEDVLAGYSFLGGLGGQQGRRFEVEMYLRRLETSLDIVEQQLGVGKYAKEWNHFARVRPGGA